MTLLKLRTLRDAVGDAVLRSATVTARATSHRIEGTDVRLNEPVTVHLTDGVPDEPLILEAPAPWWAWVLTVQADGAKPSSALTGLYTFAGEEVDWADLTPVDPSTLAPLDPMPPSATEVLARALEAVSEAEDAVDEATAALGVANTAVVDALVVGDNLRGTRKNGETFDMGNVRGLPGSAVPYGVALGNVNLDTILASGVYAQDTPANITTANNYPSPGGNAGLLEVFRVTDANIVQRYTPRSGLLAGAGFYQRRRAGTWNSWVFIAAQRVDQSAGRAIYTVDNANARDQLIYGDTGFRRITASNDPYPFSAGIISLRRVGQLVQLAFVDAVLLPSIAGNLELMNLIPVGFRPTIQGETLNTYPDANRRNRIIAIGGTSTVRVSAVDSFTVRVCCTMQWLTNDSWPTTLPGTAEGIIPNL